MFHKYIDKIFGKSIKNKNKYIPDDYNQRIMSVLNNLPETSTYTQESTETPVYVVNHERKIYFRTFATVAAVVLIMCGVSVHNNITTSRNPDKNTNATTTALVTSVPETTELSRTVVSASTSAVLDTTVTEVTTTTVSVSPVWSSEETDGGITNVHSGLPAVTDEPLHSDKPLAHMPVTEETTKLPPTPPKPDVSIAVPPEKKPEEIKTPLPGHQPEDDNQLEIPEIKDDDYPAKETLPEKVPHDGEKPVIIAPPGAVNAGNIHLSQPETDSCHTRFEIPVTK